MYNFWVAVTTIQIMKAAELYIPGLQFIWFYTAILRVKSYRVTTHWQMNAAVQYFPKILLIRLLRVVWTVESTKEILWCDHSNESYWALLYFGTVHNMFSNF